MGLWGAMATLFIQVVQHWGVNLIPSPVALFADSLAKIGAELDADMKIIFPEDVPINMRTQTLDQIQTMIEQAAVRARGGRTAGGLHSVGWPALCLRLAVKP